MAGRSGRASPFSVTGQAAGLSQYLVADGAGLAKAMEIAEIVRGAAELSRKVEFISARCFEYAL